MRKILFGLIVVATFPSSVMAADNSRMSTCREVAPQTYDCTPLVIDIDNSVPPFSWEDAKKICRKHSQGEYFVSDGGFIESFEKGFDVPCAEVGAHFAFDQEKAEVAKAEQSAKDLGQLNDFLAGSAAK